MAENKIANSANAIAEKSSGLPQLDAETYASQIFWLAVSFAILYFFMSKISLPKIAKVMHERKTKIASDLKKAEIMKEEALATKTDFTSLLKDANVKSSDIINKTLEKAKQNEAKQILKLDEEFSNQQKESQERILNVSKKFQGDLLPLVQSVSVIASKKLIKKDISSEKAQEVAKKKIVQMNNEGVK